MKVDANAGRYLGLRDGEARYSSFDYCFNYFQDFHDSCRLEELPAPAHLQLGVFGCVPAYDRYFRNGFGAATFGPKSLSNIEAYCRANADVIERHQVPTPDFATGAITQRRYTKAKVIDVVFCTPASPAATSAQSQPTSSSDGGVSPRLKRALEGGPTWFTHVRNPRSATWTDRENVSRRP